MSWISIIGTRLYEKSLELHITMPIKWIIDINLHNLEEE